MLGAGDQSLSGLRLGIFGEEQFGKAAQAGSTIRLPGKSGRIRLNQQMDILQAHRVVRSDQVHIDPWPLDMAIKDEPRNRAILGLSAGPLEKEGAVMTAIAIARQ